MDNLQINALRDGFFYLDGGSMFGIVPKTIWQKTNKPDEFNRIKLSLTNLLVKHYNKYILVDTGIGSKHDEQFQKMYNIQNENNLIKQLENYGVIAEDIEFVILTHLHFDHCGGNTIVENGKIVPTFRNAKYVIQKKAWEEAVNVNERTRGSYRADDFVPLEESGNLLLVDGDSVIVEGIKLKLTGGHTKGHQIVLMEQNDKTAVFFGDLIPTTTHVRLPYIMAYDLYPLETLEVKKFYLSEAERNNWVCYFEHDPEIISGYIRKSEKGFTVEPLERHK